MIADVEFVDQAKIAEYRTLSVASIAKQGGRYVVRGGAIEAVEGSWRPKMIVIVEFPRWSAYERGTARPNTRPPSP